MLKIALILHAVIATSLMGMAVIAVLAVDMHAGWREIALAAVAGFVLAIPVSWFVAGRIRKLQGGDS
ncbi:hypothetical protein D2V17_01885 [Aurantiacibacter xanthus]|uniref:CTP synthetase n=2 Tax=Aurantiacibacter xanthus TaxID=1784712 RepID=A0A3A1PFF2_9SPHN|nr:hypothetical protein D2V17_01885 [Aurantiacibacter xanthus]